MSKILSLTVPRIVPSGNEMRRKYGHPFAYKRLREGWQSDIYHLNTHKPTLQERMRTYVLVAWKRSPDEAWKVCEYVQAKGIKPLPQWFHALDALEHNIVSPEQAANGWNDYERRRLMQWFYQHKRAVA